jgi:hypothetical protein
MQWYGKDDVHVPLDSFLCTTKVDVPDSFTYLNQTPIFDWYVIRCGSKNKYQKDMCLKESELHAQNMITILGSIVINIMGDVYDHLMSMRIVTLMTNKIIMSSKS